MKEELYHIALDDYEHGVVIRSLNDKKTDLKKEGKSTDAVDDLIIKIGHAPRRKFKVVRTLLITICVWILPEPL